MKSKNTYNYILRASAALLVLCLAAAAGSPAVRLQAQYAVRETGSDSARVTSWDITAEISSEDAEINADSSDGDYYTFRISPGNTEVKSKYSVIVTLTDAAGLTAWPGGLRARITDGNGAAVTGYSTDGVFPDLGIFDPGETESNTYRLYFNASEIVAGGFYTVNITVNAEQID